MSPERPRRDRHPAGAWVAVLASWSTTAATWVMVRVTAGRYEWLAGAVIRDVVLGASLAVSLGLVLPRAWLAALVFPVLIPVLYPATPDVGYGGKILALAVALAAASAGLAALVTRVVSPSGTETRRARECATRALILVIVQALVVASAMGFWGGFALLPRVQNRGDPVAAGSARLGGGLLSVPTAGAFPGESAGGSGDAVAGGDGACTIFVASQEGFLLVTDLSPDMVVVRQKVSLPMPDPRRYGLEPSVPGAADRSACPWLAVMDWDGEDTLRITYPLRAVAAGDRRAVSPSRADWRVEVTVTRSAGAAEGWVVSRWNVAEGGVDPGQGRVEWGCPADVEVGGLVARWGEYGNSVHLTGSTAGGRVDTRFWPSGRVTWIATAGPYILVGTDRGFLYAFASNTFADR